MARLSGHYPYPERTLRHLSTRHLTEDKKMFNELKNPVFWVSGTERKDLSITILRNSTLVSPAQGSLLNPKATKASTHSSGKIRVPLAFPEPLPPEAYPLGLWHTLP